MVYSKVLADGITANALYSSWPLFFLALAGLWSRSRNRELWLPLIYWATEFIVVWLLLATTAGGCIGAPMYLLPFCSAWAALALRDGCRHIIRQGRIRAVCGIIATLLLLLNQGVITARLFKHNLAVIADERGLYRIAADWLDSQGDPTAVVMIDQAAYFNWATGKRAVIIPTEPDIAVLLACARERDARYLVTHNGYALLHELARDRVAHPACRARFSFAHGRGIDGVVTIYELGGR